MCSNQFLYLFLLTFVNKSDFFPFCEKKVRKSFAVFRKCRTFASAFALIFPARWLEEGRSLRESLHTDRGKE